MKYPVIFVGAGPGDPELITVKGMRALENADVVIYAGSLVPEAVLKWTASDAEILNSASMHLEEIIDKMEEAYQAEKRVVRLHTGDPSVYGAIFEQIALLARKDIPYQIIPGVTAAFAAAAATGMEYTIPDVSQTLILTRIAGRTPVPESENLASLAAHQTSMVIYLSISMIDEVSEILAKAYGKDAPCVVAFRVSQPEEKIIRTTTEALPETVKAHHINHQALIIVGKFLSVNSDILDHKSKLYSKDFSHGYRKET